MRFRNSIIRLLRRTPLWILVLVLALAWTVFQLSVRFLRGEEIDAGWVVFEGILGLFLASFALWLTFRMRAREKRLPPGSPTGYKMDDAISTGKLPDGASAGEWVPKLQRLLRQERHMMWAGPLLGGLFTALGIFLVLDSPDHPWFGALFAAASLGMAVWYPLWIRRRRVRMQGLLDQFPADDRLHQ